MEETRIHQDTHFSHTGEEGTIHQKKEKAERSSNLNHHTTKKDAMSKSESRSEAGGAPAGTGEVQGGSSINAAATASAYGDAGKAQLGAPAEGEPHAKTTTATALADLEPRAKTTTAPSPVEGAASKDHLGALGDLKPGAEITTAAVASVDGASGSQSVAVDADDDTTLLWRDENTGPRSGLRSSAKFVESVESDESHSRRLQNDLDILGHLGLILAVIDAFAEAYGERDGAPPSLTAVVDDFMTSVLSLCNLKQYLERTPKEERSETMMLIEMGEWKRGVDDSNPLPGACARNANGDCADDE